MEYCVVNYYDGEVLFTSPNKDECRKWAFSNLGEPLSNGCIIYRNWDERKWEHDVTVYDFGRNVVAIF